ncbi:hypothetical protein SprV_0100306400 [Sparganum proliferum]
MWMALFGGKLLATFTTIKSFMMRVCRCGCIEHLLDGSSRSRGVMHYVGGKHESDTQKEFQRHLLAAILVPLCLTVAALITNETAYKYLVPFYENVTSTNDSQALQINDEIIIGPVLAKLNPGFCPFPDWKRAWFSKLVGLIIWFLMPAASIISFNLLVVIIDLAIETIELLLQSKYDETENRLGHAQILHLLKLCLRTYFTFDGTIYEQVKGTPMGSPISGFIAEAVLQRLESLVFQHHKPQFWARYVDDTFVVIVRDQVLTFHEHLNAVFPDIQFTMEEEENNQLAFLDVLVCRKDCGGLKTKVFRKATNTMQVLNFNSNHPISHKRSCVRTLYPRVETHCSEPEDKIAELQYLRRVFKANGYPRNFVNRCIRKRDERPNRTATKVWRALPYVMNVSEAVGRLLAPLGVGIAHRPEATIRRLVMKPKDPLPRQETSGVVYRIWCSCGESNYVGETGRQLRTRMAEHAAAVRRNDARSQVAAHSTRPGHTFKFDEAEILARGDNRVSGELLESWFTGPQSINKCNELPLPYSVLKLRLGGVIGHAGSAQVNTHPNTRIDASDGRTIITPTSNARDEIAAINDANIGHQAINTPRATIPDEGGSRE